jgi:phenylalanyl-tRNA synthetase beta subunit
MDPDLLHYTSGEEVHASDRVQYDGGYATVVFVSNGETEEFAPGYEDYVGSDRGVVLCDDDGALRTIGDLDPLLQFVDRG